MAPFKYSPPSIPTLYHVPLLCSSIPYIVSLELDIPEEKFEIKQITEEDLHESPDVEHISPRRVVPVMALPDGGSVVEVGAIVMYLLERFDKDHKLHLPLGDADRARMFQGMFYALTECYRRGVTVYTLCVENKPEDIDQEKLGAAIEDYKKIVVQHLAKELKGKKYYAGDRFTVADIMFGYILMLGEYLDIGLIEDPVVQEYHASIKQRPAFLQPFMPAEQ